MAADIQEVVVERRLAELEADIAVLKRSMSWWHQFSATALPIMLSLVLSVFAMIVVQNGRFDELSKRIDSVESRLSTVGDRIDTMGTRVDTMGTRVDTVRDHVEQLAIAQAETRTLVETMTGDIKHLTASQDALQSFLKERLPKVVN